MHSGFVKLAPGCFHTILVGQDGSAWSTGVGSQTRTGSFVKVFSRDVKAAATGNYNSIVLKRDGSVWTTAQGPGDHLSFVDKSTTSRRTFFFAQVIPGAKQIVAGGRHSMVMTQEGHVWATGWNKYGQLGDDSTNDRTGFVPVISGGAKAAAAGDATRTRGPRRRRARTPTSRPPAAPRCGRRCRRSSATARRAGRSATSRRF